MSKKNLTTQDYDLLIDHLVNQFWNLSAIWLAIKGVREQLENHPLLNKKFPVFFGMTYSSLFNDLCTRICLLLDETQKVESLVKLLSKPPEKKPKITVDARWEKEQVNAEIDLLEKLQNHSTAKKIKNYRHNIVCHQNSLLIFNFKMLKEFHEQNTLSLAEVETFINFLGKVIKKVAVRASFRPSMLPNTTITTEIKEICTMLRSLIEQQYND